MNYHEFTITHYDHIGDAIAPLVGNWTYGLQVAGSIPGWAPLRTGLEHATYTCVPKCRRFM